MSESDAIREARESTLRICENLRETVRKLLRVALEVRSARPDEPVGTTSEGVPLTAENWMSDILKDFAVELRCIAWELRRDIRRYHRGDVVAVLKADREMTERLIRLAKGRQRAERTGQAVRASAGWPSRRP